MTGGRDTGPLLIPKSFSFAPILRSARSTLFFKLLHQPDASPLDLDGAIADIETLLAGPYTDGEGNEARAVPGEGAWRPWAASPAPTSCWSPR